jgi:DNA (cytosine-5)-methyltransferase 1
MDLMLIDKMDKVKVVSLFAGAGGLDLGFSQTSRYQIALSLDFNSDCTSTLQSNSNYFGTLHKAFTADISDPETLALICSVVRPDNEPVVLIGGPPCQSFSVLGKRRGTEDKRGSLIYSYLECLRALRPDGFLFENVPGLQTIESGRPLQWLIQEFQSLGYFIWSGVLCAADFGDATVRERFIILGSKVRPPTPPIPTHERIMKQPSLEMFASKMPWRTSFEAIGDLVSQDSSLNAHSVVNHKAEVVERFSRLSPGERDDARRRNRLMADQPSFTLFAGGIIGKLQARTHIHPILPRELTPRECARLHSFPDDYLFCGRHDSQLVQVANSVPVSLARSLAITLAEAIRK